MPKLIFLRNDKSDISPMNWDNVENFLQTWGFLPGDISIYDKLSNEQKTKLIDILLDTAWRKDCQYNGRYITKIQGLLSEFLNTP